MSKDIFFDETEHIYVVDGKEIPSITTILQPLSQRAYGQVNQSVLDYARQRGTAVHEALELMDLGAEPQITPEIVPYINAYNEWRSIYKPKWTGIEQIVYHDEYKIIGTLDRIGYLNGNELAIVDLKTSTPAKEALVSVCLQTAAYEVCYNWQEDNQTPIKRYGLFLKKDGTFRFLDCEEYEAKNNISPYTTLSHFTFMHKLIDELLATGKGKKNATKD